MKKLLCASITASSLMALSPALLAQDEAEQSGGSLSATAGFVSDYYFRGENLGDGGANGSIDYENSGFYAGVWAIDDGSAGNDGLEYDIYLGYGMEHGSFSWSVGFTDYEYTYMSQAQREINLGVAFATGVGSFGIDVALGQDDKVGDVDDAEAGYTFAALSWGGEVFAATAGFYDYDFDGAGSTGDYDYIYGEVSASGEIATADVSLSLGVKSEDNVQDDGYMVLSVSKTFDL